MELPRQMALAFEPIVNLKRLNSLVLPPKDISKVQPRDLPPFKCLKFKNTLCSTTISTKENF